MKQVRENKLKSEDGYELWLRYVPITPASLLQEYQTALSEVVFDAITPTLQAAHDELTRGLEGLLGRPVAWADRPEQGGSLVVGTPETSPVIAELGLPHREDHTGSEGYVITQTTWHDQPCIAIAAHTDRGVLYGVFRFLRHLQTHQSLSDLHIVSAPKVQLRMLNHWDNLDRTIERGYAGFSLWDWHQLPDYVSPRYQDYARANASVGINGALLTNPSFGSAIVLTHPYLIKTSALADVFRPYGIRVYLCARFSAPIELGGLVTADPLDPEVAAWWKNKADEIYQLIPDFGGFVVKANSEGQPGPHDYGRSHSQGANVIARALAPHGGWAIWRAFVYDQRDPDDRAKQAYNDLVPQDGSFESNVLLQVKNGPVDFQPREPAHPLFGSMPKTPLALEVQITQEYLGCATHLVYLAPLFKESLDIDTYARGSGSLVAHVIDGSLDHHTISGTAGVANTGTERNWCGHPFAAANWYAFGRLAWDHRVEPGAIVEEWLRMTFSNDERFIEPAKRMMLDSREAAVNYMTPLGLHHIMAYDHHYGPGPWVDQGRADWTSTYYHRADTDGLGFDRTPSGSNAVAQYGSPYRELVSNLETCPENLLLWFHHVPWQHRMRSGRILWDELCFKYNSGVEMVRQMQQTWESLAEFVDEARFRHTQALLVIQEKEARWWRDACLLYFQTFSRLPIPPEYEQPAESLEYYRNLAHYYVPGISEKRFK